MRLADRTLTASWSLSLCIKCACARSTLFTPMEAAALAQAALLAVLVSNGIDVITNAMHRT